MASARIERVSLRLACPMAPLGPVSEHLTELHLERLRQLTVEVSRLAATLARLAADSVGTESVIETGPDGCPPDVPLDLLRSVIRARRRREHYFPKELFADPAWDMMLDLLEAEIVQRRVTVSSLCIAAAVPTTTALRWLKALVDHGLFVRRPDPVDLRRVYVELSPATGIALRRYFEEIGVCSVASP